MQWTGTSTAALHRQGFCIRAWPASLLNSQLRLPGSPPIHSRGRQHGFFQGGMLRVVTRVCVARSGGCMLLLPPPLWHVAGSVVGTCAGSVQPPTVVTTQQRACVRVRNRTAVMMVYLCNPAFVRRTHVQFQFSSWDEFACSRGGVPGRPMLQPFLGWGVQHLQHTHIYTYMHTPSSLLGQVSAESLRCSHTSIAWIPFTCLHPHNRCTLQGQSAHILLVPHLYTHAPSWLVCVCGQCSPAVCVCATPPPPRHLPTLLVCGVSLHLVRDQRLFLTHQRAVCVDVVCVDVAAADACCCMCMVLVHCLSEVLE